MDYRYSQYEGPPFPTPDSLFPSPKVMRFILQYGQRALEAMDHARGDEEQRYLEAMIDAGLLERDERTGKLRLTPRLLRGLEHQALLEIFRNLSRGAKDGHPTQAAGRSDERGDGTKRYEFGDPIGELDPGATMRNVLRRGVGTATAPPLHISASDFEIHLTEGQADASLCVLLDQSGSMMRYGRFYHAKRVALGMSGLMRRHFPQDTIDFVGFYSTAAPIAERDVPLVGPKPIGTHDYEVRLRVPLEQALADPRAVPQHFTNLHLGLRLARQVLSRRGGSNKQIFIITDGQPTAHVEPNAAGGAEMLYLLYPPSQRTADATLREALRCQQQGIRIATFALVEDYYGMDWVGFVDQLTRLTRGVAFYCSGDDLASTVVESYLTGKRRKSFVG